MTLDPDGPIPLPAAPSRTRWGARGAPGLANPDRKLRGPNGRPLCRVCAREVGPRRSTFCSGGKVGLRYDRKVGLRTLQRPELWGCVEEWRVRSDPAFARAAVFNRDHGTCLRCRLDLVALRAKIDAVLHEARGGDGSAYRAARERFAPFYGSAGELWNVDHAVPVAEGGGQCGLENLRTLCVPCHRIESAALAARRKRK